MAADPTIEILLATFQGAAYLRPQMDSLFAQTDVAMRILARDDGSSDGTPDLLGTLLSENFRTLRTETPTGSATGNFRLLLQQSTARYVALADQDDVWHPQKLQRSLGAMHRLEAEHGTAAPLLVFTDLAVVDCGLQPVAPSLWRHNGIDPATVRRLGRLVGENVVTGCTALLNRPLATLAAQMPAPPPTDPLAIQHDHWIALLACTLGHAAWIAEPTVQYRQHGSNAVGAAAAQGSHFRRLFGVQAAAARQAARRRTQYQAAAFLDIYRDRLAPAQQATLQAYLDLDAASAADNLQRRWKHGLWRNGLARNATEIADLFRRTGPDR